MAKEIEVWCFPNGNYIVFRDEEQVPEAQGSWVLMIAAKLEECGINPLDITLHLPDRRFARFFKTPTGYNWKIE